MATIIVDGLPVSLADEAAVRAVIEKKDAAIADAATALTDAQAKASTESGKVAALEQQLADAKAELEPAKIDARVADRAALLTRAKTLKADIVTDGKTDAEIRRAVVDAKLGDAAKDMDDAGIVGAFLALTADSKQPVFNVVPAATITADRRAVTDALRLARLS